MNLDWQYVIWAAAIFAVSLVVSLVLVIAVVVNLPAGYFLEGAERRMWVDQYPAARIALRILKNLLGVGLVAAGILLSLPGIPGQGILTVLVGLMLVDFPGKRRLERRIITRPRVYQAINRIRRAFGKRDLELP